MMQDRDGVPCGAVPEAALDLPRLRNFRRVQWCFSNELFHSFQRFQKPALSLIEGFNRFPSTALHLGEALRSSRLGEYSRGQIAKWQNACPRRI
jgi:hypothetical protein